MKIEEAIGELKAMKPHIESGMSIVGHAAYDMAIRSLELWKELEPDTDYDDGDFWAYSKRQIEDSIARIEEADHEE